MRQVDVNEVIDNGKFNKFFLIAFLCVIGANIIDGFDMNIFGVVIPVFMKDTGLNPTQIGWLASVGLYGMLLGAIIFGTIADRIGRKKATILAVIVYSVFTGMIGYSHGMTEFIIFRFLGGAGIGGLLPNLASIMSEYTPASIRSFLMTAFSSSNPLGTVIVAGLGALLLANHGWRFMFWLAFVPLLAVPILNYYFPESMAFYVKKREKSKIRNTLMLANTGFVPSEEDDYVISRFNNAKVSFSSLFRGGFAKITILFWLMTISNYIVIYAMATWLPQLMMKEGYPLASGLWFLAIYYVGQTLVPLFGGWVADKYTCKATLAVVYPVIAIAIGLLSIKSNMFTLTVLLFIAGGGISSAIGVLYPFLTQSYPLSVRSTATGWALGIGRLGGVLGPIVGGILLSLKVPVGINFIAFAIPGVIGFVAVMLSNDYTKSTNQIAKQSAGL